MGERPARVAVVGGGVTGLTTAHRLRALDPPLDVTVLEAADHPGGQLSSRLVGGIRVPSGPEALFSRRPWGVELCRELGIELAKPAATGTWLWTDRGLVAYASGTAFGIPGDVGDVLRWPGVSRAGRRRALADLVKRRRRDERDETLGSLLRRRLGDEVTERALAPLLSDPFAGDVDRLSVRATFPELAAWEAAQGSLLRGSAASSRDVRRSDAGPIRLRPHGGVERIAAELASRLGERVLTGRRAEGVLRRGGAWVVNTSADDVDADALVLAIDADAARRTLGPTAGVATADLAQIPNVSTGVVILVYPEGTADGIPAGRGFVVPRGKAPMTACSWFSSAWPDPSFGTRAVIRCSVGGDGQEEILAADDDDIVAACARHLAALLPLPASPEHASVVRSPNAMPQYLVDHVERVGLIRDALPPGIFVAGRAFDGVDVASCVRSASAAAEGAASFVRTIARETAR
jgi:protoporphyrinogen/coproporphyrinogen III oxidase